MKKQFFLIITLMIFSTLVHAATMEDVAGDYETTFVLMPVTSNVSVDLNGNLKISMQSPWLNLDCEGQGNLINDIFQASVECAPPSDNSGTHNPVTLRINLSKVKNFNNFKAPVYSSLIKQEMEMNFKRL